MTKASVECGLDRLARKGKKAKSWGRCGLVSNQASVTKAYQPAWQILGELLGKNLTCLFGPQHGFESLVQENMIETDHGTHGPSGLPVYSLYSEIREPKPEMLKNVDTLVVDLAITGCRIYTYKYTLAACLRAAKKHGKRVVVLDRPNPLGGEILEGNVLEDNAKSFVGEFALPMRHGLTMAEAALLFNQEIGAELEVIELKGWNAKGMWDRVGREWVITSPNMPSIDACYVFPGMVLFEGTNVSEGRGTCLPFQFIGAPYIKSSEELVEAIKAYEDPPGLHLRPTCFQPSSAKWANEECRGLQIHVTDPYAARTFRLGLAMIKAFMDLGGKNFKWRDPPYEYNYELLPIDVLLAKKGANELFNKKPFKAKDPVWRNGQKEYTKRASKILLYDRKLKCE